MPIDSMREMERTPYSQPETLRVRCPHCRKLYLVQYGDIQEAKPRFECVQCRSRFWLSLSDMDLTSEVIGIPADAKDVPVRPKTPPNAGAKSIAKAPAPPQKNAELEPCPKCFKLVDVALKECNHCGVVISKLKNAFSIQENFPAHSANLESLWHKVLADYGSEVLHDEFLTHCQRENNLAYAAALYSQMVKLMPADDLTISRLGAIQKMGELMLPPTRQSLDTRAPRRMPRVWQLPLFAGVLLTVVGFSSPVFRNMAGVGAALIFFAIAIQIQLRRR